MMQLRINPLFKTAYIGLFLSLCLILSYIDSLILLFPAIPGIKLGLANLPVIICLYMLDSKSAFLLTVLKALISSLLFGSVFSMLYSLGGALCSIFAMIIFKQFNRIHIISISVIGGVFHNIGQLIVATFVLKDMLIWYYSPVLIISGIITGALLGIVFSLVNPYIKKIIYKGGNI